RLSHDRCLRAAEHYVRCATLPPSALDDGECVGRFAHDQLLLIRRQLHHAVVIVRVPERRQDLVAHAAVGVGHVSRLDGVREAERELSKLISRHGLHPCLAASLTTVFMPRNVERAFNVFSSSALENSDSPCPFFATQYSSRPFT